MNLTDLTVLSLFDGMSCGQIALRRLGYRNYRYLACEIDKHAIAVTQHNHPKTIQLGDVTKVDFSSLGNIDLLLGGSPCQGFSFAGKQLNFDDPRSKLFFEYVRALKETKPKYFLLENVLMKKEFQNIITEHLGVEPIVINSSLVSAQSRRRLYWTNIPNIGQPEDRGQKISDILETEGDVFNYSSSGRGNGKVEGRFSVSDKALTLTATGYSNRATTGVIQVSDSKEVGGKQPHSQNRLYAPEGIAPCLTESFAGRTNIVFSTVAKSSHRLLKETDKAGCLTASLFKGVRSAGRPIVSHRSAMGLHIDDLVKGVDYRPLTPVECERLQTVPDNYTATASKSQRYRMLGNGWTVEVVRHILKNMTFELDEATMEL